MQLKVDDTFYSPSDLATLGAELEQEGKHLALTDIQWDGDDITLVFGILIALNESYEVWG